MKKHLLMMILAAFVAVTSFAQLPMGKRAISHLDKAPTKTVSNLKVKNNRKVAKVNVSSSFGTRAAMDIIDTAPEGEEKIYLRSGDSYGLDYYGSTVYYEPQAGALYAVFTDNRAVYFQDLIYTLDDQDTWVKGTLSLDGKTISIPTGQCIYYDLENNYGLYLFIGDATADGDDYTMNTSINAITFAVGEDGSLTLSGLTENQMLCAFWTDDQSWSGYGDQNTVLTPYVEDLTLVTPPAGLETKDMPYNCTLTADFENFDSYSANIKMGFKGNDVYVQGLVNEFPEAWLKGSLDEETSSISFPQQFVGLKDGEKYFAAGYENGHLAPFTINLDKATGAYYSGSYLILNPTPHTFVYDDMYGCIVGIYLGQLPTPQALPDGASLVDYPLLAFMSDGYDVNAVSGFVSVAFAGNDVYFSNLIDGVAGSAVKGTFNEDKTQLTIPYGQYLGQDQYGFNLFLMGADDDGNPLDLVFDYDADANLFTCNDYVCASLNSSADVDFYYYYPGMTLGDVYDTHWIASKQGYADKAAISTLAFDEFTTGLAEKGRALHNGPKYVAGSEAMQLYTDNTLTISSSKQMARIIIYGVVSGKASCKNLGADVEELNVADDVATWEGTTNEITFTATGSVLIQKINIVYTDYSALEVEVPEELQTEPYLLTGTYEDEDDYGNPITETDSYIVQIGFNGNDFYIQGLSKFLPDAWLQGTLSDGVITIPEWGMGVYQNVLPCNYSGASFTYDAAANTFKCDGFVVSGTGLDYTVDYLENVVITTVPVAVESPKSSVAGSVMNTFDLTGRRVNAQAKGLLIKQMRQADGSVKAVKVLR